MATPVKSGEPGLGRAWLRRLGCFVAAVAGCLVLAPVAAGSLQVAPISLDFAAQQQAQGLWLSNTGSKPVNVQVRIFEWSQADGEDRLSPTNDLVPSTAILSVAPGDSQLVRLVRLRPEPPAQELSYRVLVDELPAPVAGQTGNKLQLLLRYSIPVFVLLPGATPRFKANGPRAPTDLSSLSARVIERDGKSWLVVDNHGRQRLRLSELWLIDAQGKRKAVIDGLVGYVLAGQERQWQLPVAIGALRAGTLKAKLNDDREEQSLPMDDASR